MIININEIIKNINNSDLEQYLKDWFNNVVLKEAIKTNGYDYSNELNNLNNNKIEYYAITKNDDEDHRIVYSIEYKKFGAESCGTDMKTGEFSHFVLHWSESPAEAIKWL